MKTVTIAVFLLTLLISGSYVYSQRTARNQFEEYCTTRAYGWPFPNRIEHCECDGKGGLTEHRPFASIWNASTALAFSMLTVGAFRFSLKIRR